MACKWVKLACQRHLNDIAKSNKAEFPYTFDPLKAGRICRFIEQLPHTKGDWAVSAGGRDNRIGLEPWQCFIFCCIFGWVHKATGLRRFRIAYVCVPRKNGKSILAAGAGLYMLANDGEFGAEVYTGATCKRQAWEVFRPAKQMVERTPRLREAFGLDALANTITLESSGSKFEPLVGNPGDGQSPSCAVIDEYHEHATDRLVDTMRTGMGARRQPLLWIITTAGSNIAGPCHEFQSDIEKILEGVLERDDTFGIVFTIDEGDDWTSPDALRKANPNYGISVFEEFLLTEQAAAVQNSSKQNVFQTKHLNIWVGAERSWMNAQQWKAIANAALKIEQFRGLPCWMAVDLASKRDIAAAVLVFRQLLDDVDHYYAFGRYFLPEAVAQDPKNKHYQKWVHNGHLLTTPGRVINYDAITESVSKDIKEFQVLELGFDPWNAEQFTQRVVTETGVQRIEIPNQVRFLSDPMKELDALVVDERFHHDGNPALAWMVSNIVARTDKKDNIFPNKERKESKIDGGVALIMALSRALAAAPESYTPTEVICI